MNLLRKLPHIFVLLALLGLAFMATTPVHAAGSIVVNTTDGSALGPANGKCSLREALDAASIGGSSSNGDCTGGTAGLNTIHFAIPTSDPGYNSTTHIFRIPLTSLSGGLVVVSPVIIDGTSQSGYAGKPIIELRSDGILSAPSLEFANGSAGSTVKGLMLTNAHWIAMETSAGADNITIRGNYLNTNGKSQIPAGSVAAGIDIRSNNVMVGGPSAANRNLFSGNTGVQLDGSSGTVIQGNYFGVQADGVTPIVNQTVNAGAIYIEVSLGLIPADNTIKNNVIAGFSDGIDLTPQVNHTIILGNKIGIGADGNTKLGMIRGIRISGSNSNTIGGASAADRNIIAGNTSSQILLESGATTHSDSNVIQGNYIGTNGSGTAAIDPSSNSTGIDVQDGTGNQIGGAAAGQGNVISGFGAGTAVLVYSNAVSGTSILGNRIGTDASATNTVANVTGVFLNNSAVNMGDSLTPGGNLISGNTTAGLEVYGAGTSGTTIIGNKFGVNANGTAAPVDAANGYGIYLTNSASAQVSQNWIGNSSNAGVGIYGLSTLTGGANENNCFTGNTNFGVYSNNSAATAPLSGNWWSNASGPTHSGNPGGSGDASSDYVDYSGFLTAPPPACSAVVSLDTAAFDFGDQLIGTSGAFRIATLTNAGGKIMNITALGTSAAFHLGTGAGTCPTSGTLAPGAACTIKVKFSPTAAGSASGSVTIATDAPSTPDTIALSGTGVAGTQLLKNPSFETDANLDNKPDNFTYTSFNPATDKRDCTVHKTDNCSLELAGNGLTKIASQAVLQSGAAGDDFTFALWSKAVSVPVGSVYQLQVKFFNGSTLLSTRTLKFVAGTHGFQKVSGTFTAPGGYTKVVYRILFKAASGAAWFDVASVNWAP